MTKKIEELAWAETPMGEITLRRRVEPTLQVDVYEVKLGEEFLMSSLFTDSEVALARLGLAATADPSPGPGLDVLVGGLGLGYTARAVLTDDRVASLVVVDALAEVIDWHTRHLLPGSVELTGDPRTRLVHGDFFALARGEGGLDPDVPGRRFHAVLVDIDHTPDHVLHPSHADFYSPAGLRRVRASLHPGGVFGLWSDDPPHDGFLTVLRQVFDEVDAHVVSFDNFHTGGVSACTVYVAR
ncbi:spermidine synthase [Aquipuribacter sp. MA13-6]|uniref:spermidine synthase n=1 Tax=unclassified Aquipuribacter TaxID=2635084 RepID=UPI003EE9867B